jgi:4-amino-4-deoxy-L-arabinose transferase-like glycosyltransferase
VWYQVFDVDTASSRPEARAAVTPAISRGKLCLQQLRSWWVPATLFAILVLATVLRVYDIGGNPPGFFTDEASYGYNAYSILHHGRDEYGARLPLFFKAFGEYKMPVYIYSQVPFIAILGLSEVPVRLTTAFYGIMTVLALFLLVRELFKNDGTALASAAVLAVLPWHVHYSRTGLGEITIHAFFLVLGLYLFMVGLRRPAFWIGAAVAFVLAIYSYRSAWVLTPPLLAVLAVLYHRDLIQNRRYTLIAGLILAVAIIPIVMHLTSGTSDRSKEQSIFSLHLSTRNTIENVLHGYRAHFTPGFLFNGTAEAPNLRHGIPGAGWIYPWQVPFLVLGFMWLLWKPSRPKLIAITLLVIFPLASAVSVDPPKSARAFLGAISFAIITACGIGAAVQILTSWSPTRSAALVGGALAATVVLGTAVAGSMQFVNFVHTYYGEYEKNAGGFWGWQWGPRPIIEHFLAVDDQYDELVMDVSFNEPQMFFRFYAPDGCAKCTTGNWGQYNSSERQLFALRPETVSLTYDYDVKGELYYPDGTLAFLYLEIIGNEQGRLTAEAYVEQGEVFRKLGQYTLAMDALNGAVGLDRDYALAYARRGIAALYLGESDRAVADLAKAVELDSDYLRAPTDARNPLWSLGEKNELAAVLVQAASRNTDPSISARLATFIDYLTARKS